jgi:hypothetical protein
MAADGITRTLQRAGNPKANRSFVIREGVLRLMESMSNKSEEEMLLDFISQQGNCWLRASSSKPRLKGESYLCILKRTSNNGAKGTM